MSEPYSRPNLHFLISNCQHFFLICIDYAHSVRALQFLRKEVLFQLACLQSVLKMVIDMVVSLL